MEKLNTPSAKDVRKRKRFTVVESVNSVIGKEEIELLSLEEIRKEQGARERKRKPVLSHKDQSRVKK